MEKTVSKMNIFFPEKRKKKKKKAKNPTLKFPVRMLDYPLSQWNASLSFPSSSKPIDPHGVILFTALTVLSLILWIKDWSIKIISAFVGSKQTAQSPMIIVNLHTLGIKSNENLGQKKKKKR